MLAAEQLAEVDVSEGAAKKKQTRGNFNSIYTVEPPCVTTSCMQPAPIRATYPKHQNFPSQSPIVRTSREWPHLMSNCTHFLAWWFYSLPLFLTSCKRPLDAWCSLFIHCMYYKELSVTKWNYTSM